MLQSTCDAVKAKTKNEAASKMKAWKVDCCCFLLENKGATIKKGKQSTYDVENEKRRQASK